MHCEANSREWQRRCRRWGCRGRVEYLLGEYGDDTRKSRAAGDRGVCASPLGHPQGAHGERREDSTELVAKLRAIHHEAQSQEGKEHLNGMGLDLVQGEVRDNLASGVLEPSLSKVKSIQFATEAAITILRIDDLIRLEPEQEG